jgi:hypothetical protein
MLLVPSSSAVREVAARLYIVACAHAGPSRRLFRKQFEVHLGYTRDTTLEYSRCLESGDVIYISLLLKYI